MQTSTNAAPASSPWKAVHAGHQKLRQTRVPLIFQVRQDMETIARRELDSARSIVASIIPVKVIWNDQFVKPFHIEFTNKDDDKPQ